MTKLTLSLMLLTACGGESIVANNEPAPVPLVVTITVCYDQWTFDHFGINLVTWTAESNYPLRLITYTVNGVSGTFQGSVTLTLSQSYPGDPTPRITSLIQADGYRLEQTQGPIGYC